LDFSAPQTLINLNENGSTGYGAIFLYIYDGKIGFGIGNTGASWIYSKQGIISVSSNTWYHLAFVRNGSTFTLYVDGISIHTCSAASALYEGTINWIGATNYSSPWYFKGYLSNYRITKQAIYISNFTVPTSPLTNVANTQLLLSSTNGAIIDSSTKNDLIVVGSTNLDSTVTRNGKPTIKFNGTTDYIEIPNTNELQLGSSDFTIECWFNPNEVVYSVEQQLLFFNGKEQSGFGALYCSIYHSKLCVYISYDGISWPIILENLGSSPIANSWCHLAIVRQGTNLFIYQDGICLLSNSALGTNSLYVGSVNCIGCFKVSNAFRFFNGYLADIRITKYAKYTSNFIPE